LIVDANAGQAGSDALLHEPAHRGRPTVAGIAVEDDREGHGARDVPRELEALGGGEEAGVGERV